MSIEVDHTSASTKPRNKRSRSRFAPAFLTRLTQGTRLKLANSLGSALDATVTIPIKADVFIDTIINTTVIAPIDVILDKSNLQLSTLVAKLDESIHIQEELDLKIDVPLDATVKAYKLVNVPVAATVPVTTKVPIDQQVRIKATINPKIEELTAPLHAVLKVPLTVPIKQQIQIDTKVTIPLKQLIAAQFVALTGSKSP